MQISAWRPRKPLVSDLPPQKAPKSVLTQVFRSTYEHIDGNRWRRAGSCRARHAREGETIETLEGPAVATESDWVVEGPTGEQWLVPAGKFASNYEPV